MTIGAIASITTIAMRVAGAACVACAAIAGCSHVEPPSPDTSPSVAAPELSVPASAAPAPAVSPSGSSTAARSTPSESAAPLPAPAASADPASLPQTRDRPSAAGPVFDARVAGLWNAIVTDDPQQAMPFFFPLGAYQQVKDIPDPASDWKRRLVAAYTRDVHALHARLGAGHAQLDKLDVPDPRGRWVEPGEEYNKIGYYRVFGSQLRYTVDGAPRSFEVKSLISWRGEWYVVHLSAIK